MRRPLTAAAAQPSCRPRDVAANAVAHALAVRAAGSRLVVFPELSLTGYVLDADDVDPEDPALDPLRVACGETDTVALVGEPNRFSADAVGGGIDHGHGLHDLGSDCGIGGLGEEEVDAGFGHAAHVLTPGDAALVDRRPIGVHRKGVGKDERRATIGRGMMDGDRNHAAERQAADMRAINSKLMHRGNDR